MKAGGALEGSSRSMVSRRVALAGNPNVGKSTLFNALTGLRQKVGNYPGVTVERRSGRMPGDHSVEIVDLPGAYSLNPKSLDERVVYDVLAGHLAGEPVPDLVVCVVDATNVERNLYLVTQIADLGLPVLVALNMMDAAEETGLEVDIDHLSRALDLRVFPIVASRGKGVAELAAAIRGPLPEPAERRWRLMPALDNPLRVLSDLLSLSFPTLTESQRFSEALRALSSDPILAEWQKRDIRFHDAVIETRSRLDEAKVPYRQAETMGRYALLGPIVARSVTRKKDPGDATVSDRIDAVLTHRVLGPILFVGILAVIFQAVFSWAAPVMEGIEAMMNGLGTVIRDVMPVGMAADLLVEGVIAGVGNVLVFLPQILLLFFFLGLMEDTGYMARTAFIMDRVMRRVGLSGGSVVPLLSSFACAIPGIMAARTLDNQRDRLITIMVAPLMSCSARLPVYTLFIAAFIPSGALFGLFGYQGLAMFSLYMMGTVMAFIAAWVLKKRVFKGQSGMFAMELPPYRLPQMKQVVWRMVERSKIFVVRAGRIIFVMSVVLWFLATFPRTEPGPELEARRAAAWVAYRAVVDSVAVVTGQSADELEQRAQSDIRTTSGEERPDPIGRVAAASQELEETLSQLDNEAAGQAVRNSAIGRLGRFVEPVMQPLGFDWKITTGIIAAFAAREVIVGVLGTLYSVGDADESSTALRDQLKADRYPDSGEPVFTPLVAVSLMVFFVFALQCMSTLAIARRETNSWLWPAVMWFYMTGLAYLCSLAVYQGGLALGLG